MGHNVEAKLPTRSNKHGGECSITFEGSSRVDAGPVCDMGTFLDLRLRVPSGRPVRVKQEQAGSPLFHDGST